MSRSALIWVVVMSLGIVYTIKGYVMPKTPAPTSVSVPMSDAEVDAAWDEMWGGFRRGFVDSPGK